MKTKRTFFYLLLLSLLVYTNNVAFAQWEQIQLPDSIEARSIYFNDDDIYLGTNSGVYYSNDNCETWEYLGLELFTVHAILITSENQLLVGGTGRIFKYLGDTDWQTLYVHDGNIIFLMESSIGYLFFSSFGSIHRSINSGETWDMVMETLNSEVIKDIDENSIGVIFAGSTSYIGGSTPGGIYHSVDSGANWNLVGLDYHFVSSIEINSHDTIFAGTQGHWSSGGGGVFKSLDETGNLWQNVYEYNLITSMCINEFNTLIIGCSTLDGAPGGVHKSFDGGNTWIDISGDLPSRYVDEVTFNPDNLLYVITHSQKELFRLTDTITNICNNHYNKFKIYPNPARNQVVLKLPQISKYKMELIDLNGRIIKYDNFSNEDFNYYMDISDLRNGIYIIKIYNRENCFTQKLIKY